MNDDLTFTVMDDDMFFDDVVSLLFLLIIQVGMGSTKVSALCFNGGVNDWVWYLFY